jgi:hypothetical protein
MLSHLQASRAPRYACSPSLREDVAVLLCTASQPPTADHRRRSPPEAHLLLLEAIRIPTRQLNTVKELAGSVSGLSASKAATAAPRGVEI